MCIRDRTEAMDESIIGKGALNDKCCGVHIINEMDAVSYTHLDVYKRQVNERTRLSLYADFLYPLASDSTLEDFYLSLIHI